MSVQQAKPALPIVHLCEGNKTIVFFAHIHNSSTCNGDNFSHPIKTANAHKDRILPQTIINTCKKYLEGLKHSQK